MILNFEIKFLTEELQFSLLQSVQTSSGVPPACHSVGTGDLSPGVDLPGREADCLSPWHTQ